MSATELICDGCGQSASPEHIAQRLGRLERMTRYRPLHIQALFLAAVSPAADADYLYSASGNFRGEAAALLDALGVDRDVRPSESVLAEFQRRGYLLAYVLECPIAAGNGQEIAKALEQRIATTAVRIRRSFKPKKVVLLGEAMDLVRAQLAKESLGAEVVAAESGQALRVSELARFVTAITAAGAASL